MRDPLIETVMIDAGLVLIEGGVTLPITHWFDCDGEECEPDDAVSIVAGTDDYGWLTIDVSGEAETVH